MMFVVILELMAVAQRTSKAHFNYALFLCECVCVLMCVSKVDLKFPCFLLITESVLFSWRSVRWEIDGRWTAIKRSLIANKRGFITAAGM